MCGGGDGGGYGGGDGGGGGGGGNCGDGGNGGGGGGVSCCVLNEWANASRIHSSRPCVPRMFMCFYSMSNICQVHVPIVCCVHMCV